MQAVQQQQAPTMLIASDTGRDDHYRAKSTSHQLDGSGAAYERLKELVSSSAVVLFTASDCCMCHVAKQLLRGLGVAPVVIELRPGEVVYAALLRLMLDDDETTTTYNVEELRGGLLPTVFVGGKLLGGIESLMASHINGSLVPRLKDAGALWL